MRHILAIMLSLASATLVLEACTNQPPAPVAGGASAPAGGKSAQTQQPAIGNGSTGGGGY
jgi:hypothetical protein